MAIHIEKSFADCIGRLNKETKAKVTDTLLKVETDINSKGLNFEKVHQAADKDIYSLRVDKSYRIICKCPGNNIVIFLFVGNHDDAYDWAMTHTCSPDVNGVASVHASVEPARKVVDGKQRSRLFAFTDDEFKSIGVYSEFIEPLRSVFTNNQLSAFKDSLSEETYFALEYVLDGASKEEAIQYYHECLSRKIVVPSLKKTPLFDISNNDMAQLGVPVELLDLVKDCRVEDDFKRIENKLPENAVQNLYSLMEGESAESLIRRSKAGNKPEEEDYSIILNNRGTKQNIATINDEFELNGIMEMPMEKWRVFLHPTQRQIVDSHYNGPARIFGGAGTGKTVIIVHRAKALASECTGDERVLVTTFSNTLAEDIYSRLKLICREEELDKIVVSTLDMLVSKIESDNIKYNNPSWNYNQSPLEYAWSMAQKKARFYDFNTDFYMSEWSDVIQAQDLKNREEYLYASRIGRGNKKIDLKARNSIYNVMECYKEIMQKNHWVDIDWAENRCAKKLIYTKNSLRFKHILVDECQDFKGPAFRLIRALAGKEHPNDLFLSGDTRQRIYSSKVALSNFGIFVKNRSIQLKINYRTTREIHALSLKIQKGFTYDDMDNNPVGKEGSISTRDGEEPKIKGFSTKKEEMAAILGNVKRRISEGTSPSDICISGRTNAIAEEYCEMLKKNGIESIQLKQGQPDDKSVPGVRTSTMHRIKGMEFDYMYAVSVNKDIMPFAKEYDSSDIDELDKKEILKREANLLSVAITRARHNAWITYYGKPSELLKNNELQEKSNERTGFVRREN